MALGARGPAGAHRGAAARRQARARGAGDAQRGAVVPDAVQRDHGRALRRARDAARVLGLPSIPRRIECFDISTIQGSETVASMVVCEDGRMKKSEYRKVPHSEIRSGFGVRTRCQDLTSEIPSPESPTPNPRPELHDPRSPMPDDFAAMREVVQRRYRKVIEDGGPFPGSDPDRRRQRSAAPRPTTRWSRSASATWWRSASPSGKSCSSRAIGRSRSCCPRTIRRCCSCSASATKRIGSR